MCNAIDFQKTLNSNSLQVSFLSHGEVADAWLSMKRKEKYPLITATDPDIVFYIELLMAL